MYSKETPNLKLPQWQPLDHPDFLTDFNESFKKLDELGQVIPDNEKQQEQIDNLTQQIVDLTEVIKELEDRIDNMSDVEVILQMKEDIDRLKAEVTALTEKNATQDTSIGEITAHLTIIDSDISTIKQRLDDYKETIDSNTAAISQNSQSITELENSLATLQTTVTNILTRLSAVEQLANQNTNNISEINTTMASLQNSVSGAVSAAEQAGQDATSAVNTANLAHSDAEAAVATANAAKTTADGMDARITAAQGTADEAQTAVTNLTTAISADNELLKKQLGVRRYQHTFTHEETSALIPGANNERLVIAMVVSGTTITICLYAVAIDTGHGRHLTIPPHSTVTIDLAVAFNSVEAKDKILILTGGYFSLGYGLAIELSPKGTNFTGGHIMDDFNVIVTNATDRDMTITPPPGQWYGFLLGSAQLAVDGLSTLEYISGEEYEYSIEEGEDNA